MKLLFVSLLALASSAEAQAGRPLFCKALYNNETVLAHEVEVKNERATFGEFDEFTFYLTAKNDNKVELQSYNAADPSRSYATAILKDAGDVVELSIWNNFHILDVQCKLK